MYKIPAPDHVISLSLVVLPLFRFTDEAVSVNIKELSRQHQASHLPVQGVEHLNDDEGGQSHAWGLEVIKDITVDTLEVLILHKALRLVGL